MKALAYIAAVALALMLAGCMATQQGMGDAKVGTGNVPRTRSLGI